MTTKADHVRAAPNDDLTHTCHWPGCTRQCKPAFFSCKPHWYRWPQHIRDAIWSAYRPGQENTKTPSARYIQAARAAEEWAITYERAKTTPDTNQGSLEL